METNQLSRSVVTSWGNVIVKSLSSMTLDVNDYVYDADAKAVVQIKHIGKVLGLVDRPPSWMACERAARSIGKDMIYVERNERCKEIESIVHRIDSARGESREEFERDRMGQTGENNAKQFKTSAEQFNEANSKNSPLRVSVDPVRAMFPGCTFPVSLDQPEGIDEKVFNRLMEDEVLDNWFTYHAPDAGQSVKMLGITSQTRELARLIMRAMPHGRERALALTKLREARMWANAGIVCKKFDENRF